MKKLDITPKGHAWTRTTAVRVFLTLGSLVSMILASGAGGHWH